MYASFFAFWAPLLGLLMPDLAVTFLGREGRASCLLAAGKLLLRRKYLATAVRATTPADIETATTWEKNK